MEPDEELIWDMVPFLLAIGITILLDFLSS